MIALFLSATLFLSLGSPLAHADTEADFQVEVDPATYPAKEFEQKGVRVSKITPRVKRPDALPEKSERDRIFSRVPGLEGDIAKMDELDRDLLFVRARMKPLKELSKIYPGIARNRLAQIKKEIGK